MHIEPGFLHATKIAYANATAASTLAVYGSWLVRRPALIVKIALAAVFFSLFMQSFHRPVGPSELHFIGASFIYFLFGFVPTLFGFVLGLLLQGVLFEPQDLVHLGVNSLSLMVPLIAVHSLRGRKHFKEGEGKLKVSFREIARFDAAFYAGVTGMVGFWLVLGEEATALSSWGYFALSYVPVVLCEPIFTYSSLKLLSKLGDESLIHKVTELKSLSVA